MRSFPLILASVVALGACVPTTQPAAPPVQSPTISPEQAVLNFHEVLERVEPVAEQVCREQTPDQLCDFAIYVDRAPDSGVNAFHTIDDKGQPAIIFTIGLIAVAQNTDELAFVMGHEAAHHIAGHLTRQRDTAAAGAVLVGVLAQVSGGGAQDIAQAQNRGAALAARGYSKELELEADSLGAEIAYVAGFDPRLGAAFFDRLPDPGDQFLGTHPAHEARKRVVAESVARLGG